MKTVCNLNECTGCQACANICAKDAISLVDSVKAYNAEIDESICINCGACERVCPVNSLPEKEKPFLWKQGWAIDEDIRRKSSSGGVAATIQNSFVLSGGVVCSCVFENGSFVFSIAHDTEEIKRFAGSKYVKSNPQKVYMEIYKLLKKHQKVLFVGLPCQCAAVKNFCLNNQHLYTVDLICHGTPSPKLLNMYLSENNIAIAEAQRVDFREKTKFGLYVNGEKIVPDAVRDRYIMAFLDSVCYTENCYNCQYATTERVSDLTLGDSWGSDLDEAEIKKGISLILCQSPKGLELINQSAIHLEDVCSEKAVQNNKQLIRPATKPQCYEAFFNTLEKKDNFSKTMFRCYPKECSRQNIKKTLIKLKLINNR